MRQLNIAHCTVCAGPEMLLEELEKSKICICILLGILAKCSELHICTGNDTWKSIYLWSSMNAYEILSYGNVLCLKSDRGNGY